MSGPCNRTGRFLVEMKRALQLLIVLACTVSLACACGLAWVFVPYSIGEAFNSSGLIRTPGDFAAERFLHVWILYLLTALAITAWLFVTYRRNYRPKRKVRKPKWLHPSYLTRWPSSR